MSGSLYNNMMQTGEASHAGKIMKPKIDRVKSAFIKKIIT